MEAKLRRRIGMLLLVLGACQAAPPPAASLRVGLLADGRTIEIRADDRLAIAAAELRLPGHAPVAAAALHVTPPAPDLPPERPGVGVGGSGGSSSGMDVGGLFRVPVARGETRPRLARSVARIEIPDVGAYRAHAAQGVVRVTLATPDGAERRIVDLPAP